MRRNGLVVVVAGQEVAGPCGAVWQAGVTLSHEGRVHGKVRQRECDAGFVEIDVTLHDVFVGTDRHEVLQVHEGVGLLKVVRLCHPVLSDFRTFEDEGKMRRILCQFGVVDFEGVISSLVAGLDDVAAERRGRVFVG